MWHFPSAQFLHQIGQLPPRSLTPPHPPAVDPVATATEGPATSTTPSPGETSTNTPPPAPIPPLVAAGLIQPDLAEVLTWVQTKRKTFRCITADVRVVTGEEYKRLLQEREDHARVAAGQREQRAWSTKTVRASSEHSHAPQAPCSSPSAPPITTAPLSTIPASAASSSSSSTLHPPRHHPPPPQQKVSEYKM